MFKLSKLNFGTITTRQSQQWRALHFSVKLIFGTMAGHIWW